MDRRKLAQHGALLGTLWLFAEAAIALPSGPIAPHPLPPLAQVDPNRDRLPDSETPAPLPPSPPVAPPPESPAQPPATPQTFSITDIQVVGSSVFDDKTLDAIVAPYENRDVTVQDLQDAANQITQRYLEDGYITSRAVLVDQTLVGGVVRIQVIEGELESIQIQGTERLQDYVRSRVALGGDRPLNQASLEDQLRLLRADPLFTNVEASLRAGSGIGQSRLLVRVTEAPSLSGALTTDNNSPIAVGDVRFGARLEYRNPAGFGDTLFAAATVSDTLGSQVYDLGYQIPLNPMNGTLLLRMTPNEFRITDTDQPAAELGVEGETDIYTVRYRQPLIRTPREELALSVGFRHRDGETLITNTITDASRTSVVSFGQDYVRRDLSGAWALRSQFRLGTSLLNATEREGALPDGQFLSWLGQVQRVQQLGDDHRLILRADVQLSADSLLGSEQFFIGGGDSVRGYAQNQRFGDSGIRFSLEDQIVLQRYPGGEPFLRIAPFLDGGYVWYHDDDFQTTDNNFLLGTGVGFIANFLPRWEARLDFAVPLIDVQEQTTDPDDGLRLHFNLGFQF